HLSVPRDERERAVDAGDRLTRAGGDARARVLDGHVGDAVDGRVGEVVDAVKDVVGGHRISSGRGGTKVSANTARKRANPLQCCEMAPTSSGETTPAEGVAVSRAFGAVAASARPAQWVKNLVVALPFLFGAALTTPRGWWLAAAGVVVFCAV